MIPNVVEFLGSPVQPSALSYLEHYKEALVSFGLMCPPAGGLIGFISCLYGSI